MNRMVVIALSRADEDALHLIAQGIDEPTCLSIGDIDVLKKLSLVEEHEGLLYLTALGRLRKLQTQGQTLQAAAIAACGLGRRRHSPRTRLF